MSAICRRVGSSLLPAPMELMSRWPDSCAHSAMRSFCEIVSMASTVQSGSGSSAICSSMRSLSRNARRAVTSQSGFTSSTISRMTSALGRPSVERRATACRLMLLGVTQSRSSSTRCPTPPRASAIAQFEPTPPSPKTVTVESARRLMPSSPKMSLSRSNVPSSCSSGVSPVSSALSCIAPSSFLCPGLSRAFSDACRPSGNAHLAKSISIVGSFARRSHSMRAICARMHYSYPSFNRFDV